MEPSGPGASADLPASSRSEQIRESNRRVAAAAEKNLFVAGVPFACECGDAFCNELVALTLEQYSAARLHALAFIVAPDHQLEGGGEPAGAGEGYRLFVRR